MFLRLLCNLQIVANVPLPLGRYTLQYDVAHKLAMDDRSNRSYRTIKLWPAGWYISQIYYYGYLHLKQAHDTLSKQASQHLPELKASTRTGDEFRGLRLIRFAGWSYEGGGL